MRRRYFVILLLLRASVSPWFNSSLFAAEFSGKHFSGSGDVEYIELLDTSRRMFEPDAQFLSLPMLYEPKWNGFVEGPTWDAWWIQNSYGTTFAALPFLREPYVTFLQNAQDLWFDKQGDGKRADKNGYVAPDGCLCDAANLDGVWFRQGDARHDIHDWFMEATAAGVVMQAELLLIWRDDAAIERYLPKLERAANFIEMRRDPATGLYQGGVACNLLAPSFGGYLKPDGTRGFSFHAGLQVTYIAALDRLIELEKLAKHRETASGYERRRDLAKASLSKLVTEEGYFINSIDPDGTKHGVFGAAKHGYFESSVNHDAVTFRVADDALAKTIFAKIESIPQLRPHAFVIPNYPSYDDMYEKPVGLWEFGRWVNGGHWSTCEARMIVAYYRMGKFDDARRSMKQLMKFARAFRMDNPLVDFGDNVYQPRQPINITYDAFGPPAAMVRGLFEYQYRADRLVLNPHIPAGITQLRQHDPIRFGGKKIFLSTVGKGRITAVNVNGDAWQDFTGDTITLLFDQMPDEARIEIKLGYDPSPAAIEEVKRDSAKVELGGEWKDRVAKLEAFQKSLKQAGLVDSYESGHARLIVEAVHAMHQRAALLKDGKLEKLPEPSAAAADKIYADTPTKLFNGFVKVMERYAKSSNECEAAIARIWSQ